METGMDERLVIELARDTVREVAPQELQRFSSTSTAFLRNKRQLGKEATDELLAFGAQDAITYLTPIVLLVSSQVIQYLTEPAKEAIKASVVTFFTERVKQWMGKKSSQPQELKPLTPEQLRRAHELAMETLRQYKLSDRQRNQIADSMIGKLALLK